MLNINFRINKKWQEVDHETPQLNQTAENQTGMIAIVRKNHSRNLTRLFPSSMRLRMD